MAAPEERAELRLELPRAELEALQRLARAEGCDPSELAAQALRARLSARGPRPEVLVAYARSHARFASLYERLAQ